MCRQQPGASTVISHVRDRWSRSIYTLADQRNAWDMPTLSLCSLIIIININKQTTLLSSPNINTKWHFTKCKASNCRPTGGRICPKPLLWFTVLIWILWQWGPIDSEEDLFILATHANRIDELVLPSVSESQEHLFQETVPVLCTCVIEYESKTPTEKRADVSLTFRETCFNGNDIIWCMMNGTWFKLPQKKRSGTMITS